MGSAGVNRLPVLEDGKLVGILSSHDIGSVIKEEIDSFMSIGQSYKSK
jgi:CBS domain-containing protein